MGSSTEKLVKLLNLTASPVDGEALNAIRMANKYKDKLNLRWENLLVDANSPCESNYKSTKQKRSQRHTDDDIPEMFDWLFDNLDEEDSIYSFVESVHDFWEKTKFLTEKQYDALHNIYDRARSSK